MAKNSKKFQSLSIRNATTDGPLHLDSYEIAGRLLETLRQHRKVMDPGMYELLINETDLLAFLIADEYSADSIWNMIGSIFGQGILLGLLAESVATYYAMLDAEANGNDDDDDGDLVNGQY